MQGYRTVRTKNGNYKFIKKEEYGLFVKISNLIWPYAIGILATYGFMDLMLRANGF